MADYSCKKCGFRSTDHETKAQADARGEEHEQEHETNEPMREIGEFLKEVN